MSADLNGTTPALLVTGLGALSPAGGGADAFEAALRAGRPMPLAGERPDDTGAAPLLAAARGGAVGRLAAWDDRRHTGADRRRLSRLGRMAVTAAGQALEAGGLEPAAEAGEGVSALTPEDLERTGVVFGTGYGNAEDAIAFLDGVAQRGAEFANPALFPTSVLNASAAHVSLRWRLTGYGATVAARDLSGELAIVQAADALLLDRADRILAGGADEALPTLAAGLRRLRLLRRADGSEASPFIRRAPGPSRGGVALGEGAAVLLLERADRAGERGKSRARVVLAGWASGGAPAPGPLRYAADGGVAAASAATAALAAAGVEPGALDLVVLGASGLREMDEVLAAALRRVGGARLATGDLPLCAPRAVTGWFPASGVHLAVAAVLAVSRGFLPATPGVAWASLPGFRRVCENRRIRNALVLGAGAGGAVAALVFRAV